MNQAEIARLLGLAPSNVRERLKKLAALGMASEAVQTVLNTLLQHT
ncbi:DNA-binding Lrp family transcriptional regulator [Neisseria sp. HSC-16F19]|nr:winged helix-turn-helix transcriptional regulator [Neisseria sp. HSC-16F19]MCP2041453.1 DNA-binding Lrp family transcriptional regulator [Neisseria sp. HSC-16F19]